MKKLINLANTLDQCNKFKVADKIDNILKMSSIKPISGSSQASFGQRQKDTKKDMKKDERSQQESFEEILSKLSEEVSDDKREEYSDKKITIKDLVDLSYKR